MVTTGDQPFTTTNAILAYCLHLAGVPWENDHQAARVFYSAEILNKFTNGSGQSYYKGWELEKAVAHAHKTGRRGHVEYVFKKTDRIDILIDAFVKQSDALKNDEGNLHDLVRDLERSELEDDVATVRKACVYLKMRSEFMDIWKVQVPLIIIPNPGRVERSTQVVNTKDGVREAQVVETPGFRVVSLNASKETKAHLGL